MACALAPISMQVCAAHKQGCSQCFCLPYGSQTPSETSLGFCFATQFCFSCIFPAQRAVLAAFPLSCVSGQRSMCSSCGSYSSTAPLAGQDQMGYQACSRHRGQDFPAHPPSHCAHISLASPPQPQLTPLSQALPLCMGICSCREPCSSL